MPLLTIANVHHSYGTQIVLDGATLSIEPGEKVGLVGRNGSGKTTLMRIVQGKLTPDSGTVQFQKNARVGYLSQDPDLDPADTLRDAAERAFTVLHELHLSVHELYEQMASAEGDELEKLMKKQARLEVQVEAAGGYAIDHKIDAMLHGLGFTDEQFTIKVGSLSGGQKGRLGLVRLLLEEPDLLLLDEPTNHLDIDGRRWLEAFLADEYAGAVIVVSHDRWLLDRVAQRIIDVEQGAIREYPGNYHKYIELRQERQLTQARVHEKQKDKIRQEQQFISRYKTGQRAKQARGRQSRLDRYKENELVERPIEMNVMRLQLPKAPPSGDQVIVAEGLAKRYGDLTLFENFDLTVFRGERIGIIGPNGIGKTTLVRVLLGDLAPDEGTTRLGSRVSVGYYRQLHEHIDQSLTVWQYLQSVIVALDGQAKASEQQARDLAGAFLFSGAEQDKQLIDVSGGERSRAVLAGLVAGAHNVLVLDEPTNHLDIPSAERIEAALSRDGGYQGTLIVITHDRALLEATCDRLIIFEGNGVTRVFPGTYTELERQAAAPARTAEPARPEKSGKSAPANSRGGGSGGGGSGRGGGRNQERKKGQKGGAAPELKSKGPGAPRTPRGRAGKSSIRTPRDLATRDLESRIETLEQNLRDIDLQLQNPDVYTDGAKCRTLKDERDGICRELTPLEEEWSSRATES